MRASITRIRAAAAATLLAALCAGCAQSPAQTRAQIEVAPSQCVDFSFPIYFKDRADYLGTAALQVIADASQRAKACRIGGVRVTGLSAPDELSSRRAKVVAQALGANGLPQPSFEAGRTGPPKAHPGLMRPLDRRVEVLIHFEGS